MKEQIWYNMSPEEKKLVVFSHAKAFKTEKIELLTKLFHLGNPKIIWENNKGKLACRIAPESVEIMKLLCNNYLT